ncbi:MAG: CRISPR-associated endonuclease Cas1 [Bryobacterales bacterium]|nr:CRISPR-associated endonuclease Cas1 [Bryobacterales bacterium]
MFALPFPETRTPRKPPAAAQYNWLTERYDSPPEQLELDLPTLDDVLVAEDGPVSLLTTENGAQLYVAGFGLFLGKKSERVVVKKDRQVCAQVPFLRLQEIVVGSRGVSLSSDLLEELCARGIRLAFLNNSGKPYALITSPLLTATVETRRAQMAAIGSERGAELARWMVAGKIHNQEKLLRYFGKSRTGEAGAELNRVAGQLRGLRRQALEVSGDSAGAVRGTLMGYEGTAGRLYWKAIRGILPEGNGFEGRNPHQPGDAVNAALNYGYGILYGHVWGAVMNAGLEPFAGFLHTDQSGKPSLVLDLVEEFRQPVVDRAIFSWLTKGGSLVQVKGMLDAASREAIAGRVMLRLQSVEPHRGKSHQIRSVIQMQARLAASAVRGMREYRPFAFKW